MPAAPARPGIGYPQLIARIVEMAVARGRASRRPRTPLPRRPPVAGARLRLEPPAPRHLAALARWFSDEESGRYMDDPGAVYTEEELAEAFFVGREDVDYVACDRSTGEPVGYCGLYDIENRRAADHLSHRRGLGARARARPRDGAVAVRGRF